MAVVGGRVVISKLIVSSSVLGMMLVAWSITLPAEPSEVSADLEREFKAATDLVVGYLRAIAEGDSDEAEAAYDASTSAGQTWAKRVARLAEEVRRYRELEELARKQFGPDAVTAVRDVFRGELFLKRIGLASKRFAHNQALWKQTTHVYLSPSVERGVFYSEVWGVGGWLVRKRQRWYIETDAPVRVAGTQPGLRPQPADAHYLPIETITRVKKLVRKHADVAAFKKAVRRLRKDHRRSDSQE